MSDDSPSGTTTTIQNTNVEPWSGQEGYLRNLYSQAGSLATGGPTIDQAAYLRANPDVAAQVATGQFGGALDYLRQRPQAEQNLAFSQFGSTTPQPQYFPGQTFVDYSPESLAALDLTTQRALAGSPVNQAAAQQLTGTLRGDYLDPGNPWLGNVGTAIERQVRPAVDSRMAAANRMGSGASDELYARTFADAIAPYAFQNYENERQRQMAGVRQAPTTALEDYRDFSALQGVGAAREAQSQLQLQDAMNRYQFGEDEILRRLGQMQAFTGGGNYSQQQQQAQTPYYEQSPWLTGLGALGTGAGIFGSLGGADWLRDL